VAVFTKTDRKEESHVHTRAQQAASTILCY
jgi:hypothetical protein